MRTVRSPSPPPYRRASSALGPRSPRSGPPVRVRAEIERSISWVVGFALHLPLFRPSGARRLSKKKQQTLERALLLLAPAVVPRKRTPPTHHFDPFWNIQQGQGKPNTCAQCLRVSCPHPPRSSFRPLAILYRTLTLPPTPPLLSLPPSPSPPPPPPRSLSLPDLSNPLIRPSRPTPHAL